MQISKVSDSFAYDFMKDNKGKCTDLGEVKKIPTIQRKSLALLL